MVHVILLNTGFHHRSGWDRHAYFECGIDRQRPVFHLGMMAGTERVGLERYMKNIVDEDGEIIAKATDDHTLIGGHHRLAVAASLGQKLFWKDTGESVRLDPFFKGSSHRNTA
jgi:hypothetical protein